MHITPATPADLPDALAVERAAFGGEDEAELVRDLLAGPTAAPALSLLARDEDARAIGHILFTAAHIADAPDAATLSLLAPLAVVPDAQGTGVGGALIARGIEILAADGVDLILVLGHPGYYPRHGFEPAAPHGLIAPYPIPDEVADAWMVRALRPGVLGSVRGTIACADALMKPEMWRE